MNKIRCVSTKGNDWGMFPAEIANDKTWQASTGFIPQPIEPAPTLNNKPVITEDSAPSPIKDETAPQPIKAKPGRKAKTNLNP